MASVESVQDTPYRLVVTMGVAFLPFAKVVTKLINDGDKVCLNIVSRLFENLTTGQSETYEPLPEFLIDIIAAGGSKDHVRNRLNEAGKISA